MPHRRRRVSSSFAKSADKLGLNDAVLYRRKRVTFFKFISK